MDTKKKNEYIKMACDLVGGQSGLARLLGVSCPTVNQWVHGVRPVPAGQCPKIERILDGRIKCEHLRQDIDWSYLRGQESASVSDAGPLSAA